MKPDPQRLIEVAAAHLLVRTAPALQGYEQSSVGLLAMLLLAVREEYDRAAAQVGLDKLDDAEWIAHFGRFAPLPDTLEQPLALRYHGHQFRVYNPDIGDGRGFLFAQLRDGAGRLMDLGTKGSGQTPYSRFGDGRLTLKGAVRELLATEMLEALGVETSKTFSIVETGEALERNDEPSPTRSARTSAVDEPTPRPSDAVLPLSSASTASATGWATTAAGPGSAAVDCGMPWTPAPAAVPRRPC